MALGASRCPLDQLGFAVAAEREQHTCNDRFCDQEVLIRFRAGAKSPFRPQVKRNKIKPNHTPTI